MPTFILNSVGASGLNRYDDVRVVQLLLTQKGVNPGVVDGLCGPRTVHAILDFQAQFLSQPDGRVDPNGTTWRHLMDGAQPQAPASPAPSQPQAPAAPRATTAQGQALTTLVPRPSRDSINPGLTAASNAFMLQHLGRPRDTFSQACQPITHPTLKRNIVTQNVGPFRVTGLRPAVDSLRNALAQVRSEQPAVHHALGTAGMLCCRFVRGSTRSISNHSWGTAIDFTLNGVLDRRGDNRVQVGLTLIASIMNQHGWYWGAAFRTEDAMHFEGSQASILSWSRQLL